MVKYLLFVVLFGFSQLSFNAISADKTAEEKASDVATKLKTSPEMQKAIDNLAQSNTDNLTTSERVQKYVKSGFLHIVPKGLDHILFIVALFLSTTIFSRLFWQVTCFTLAHTLTLGMATIWGISLTAGVVEPLIALSIVFIAGQNILQEERQSSSYVITFLFGLLHGFGFAFVLSDFGLSNTDLAVSLASFNVGVELGQLSVIAGLLLIFYYWSKLPSYRAFVQVPLSLIVGIFGLYWMIERII